MTIFLLSFLLTAGITPIVILLARKLGWMAKPRQDRWHSQPTALMGGIAIFLGTALGVWVLAPTTPFAVLGWPVLGVFVLGVVDDRVGLSPSIKLVGQLAASAYVILHGGVFEALPTWLAMPLTLIWLVGITNAVNLLDNMDGLAAGVSTISALVMAAYCGASANSEVVGAILALAGACTGFLIYNFSPARIFMGDCGSMFIGFTLAALAVSGTHRTAPNLVLSLLVPVAVLAIPIFDTTLVSITRILHGRSVSQGGRDHSSHRLVALGLSERAAVLTFYGLTALFGTVALLATRVTLLTLLLVSAILFTGLTLLGFYLGFLKVYKEGALVPPHVPILGGTLQHKKQLLQVALDVFFVPVALLASHLLRFEGELPSETRLALLTALPIAVFVKLITMAAIAGYRGVWRYVGMRDALRAAGGSTLGSIALVAILWSLTGLVGISKAALVMDWLLFTVLTLAGRTAYVILRELFGMVPPRNGIRVIILGAGSEAISTIQKLRDPLSTRRALVAGILDDDPTHFGCTINGVPVLGPVSELSEVIRERGINCCILGVASHSEAGQEILDLCYRKKVAVYRDLDAPPLDAPLELHAWQPATPAGVNP